MCVDLSPPAPPSAVLHDVEIADPIMLDPVDSVEIVSLMDNVTDVFMPDQGPARRGDFILAARCDCGVMAGGTGPDALGAEHGFSMLITVRKGDRTHRILFDTGISPDGVVANMRRLGIDPGSIEAIIWRHGHFDHTTGPGGGPGFRPQGTPPPGLPAGGRGRGHGRKPRGRRIRPRLPAAAGVPQWAMGT